MIYQASMQHGKLGNATISPTLDYENLNHFLLGYAKAKGQP